jgi:uncharacterized protein
MVSDPNAKLLRIFIGENDKCSQQPLYEKLVFDARKFGLQGATVLRGIMGYGANNMKMHTAKLFEISSDLPMVIEIVDSEEKVRAFLDSVKHLFEQSKSGVLVTLEKAEVIIYKPGNG